MILNPDHLFFSLGGFLNFPQDKAPMDCPHVTWQKRCEKPATGSADSELSRLSSL